MISFQSRQLWLLIVALGTPAPKGVIVPNPPVQLIPNPTTSPPPCRHARGPRARKSKLECAKSRLAQVRHGRGEKLGKWFGISSGYLRVCTTFLIKTEAVGDGDAELVEQLFLFGTGSGDAA